MNDVSRQKQHTVIAIEQKSSSNRLMLTSHQMTFQVISPLQINFQRRNRVVRVLLELCRTPVILIVWCEVVARICVLSQTFSRLDEVETGRSLQRNHVAVLQHHTL